MNLTQRRILAILASVLALGSWIAYELYTSRQMEDSWITFRYARNILEGHGMVFNPGERVLGTTTPLFTLLLALLGALFGHQQLQLIGDILSIASCLGAGWLLYSSFNKWGESLSVILAAAFVFNPVTMWIAAGGMETAMVVFLMILCWWAAENSRIILSGLTSGLLVLSRPDTLVWIGLVSLALLLRSLANDNKATTLKKASKWLIACFAIVAPWILFAWWYYGSPIPNTMSAKLTIDASNRSFSLVGLGEVLQLAGITNGSWSLNSVAQSVLFLLGIIYISTKRSIFLWIFPIYSILFSAVLYFGNAPYADWYWVPCKWTTMVVSVIGCYHLVVSLIIRVLGGGIGFGKVLYPLLGLTLVAYSIFSVVRSAPHYRDYQIVERQTREATGLWLRDSTLVNATVLTEAIGYIGYYSDRPIIDLAGLVSPQVVGIAKQTSSNGELFREIIRTTKPAYVVLRAYEVRDNRHFHGGKIFPTPSDSLEFVSLYRSVATFHPPIDWGEMRAFTTYARQ